MKKHIRISFLAIALSTLLVSCEDFLSREPLTQLNEGSFWKTEAEVQAALAATYSTYRTSIFGSVRGSNGVAFAIEALSDNAVSTSGYAGYSTILNGGITPSTGNAINQFWSDCYDAVSHCNYFLDNLDRAKGILSETNYNKYKGEALFNRAFFYNELVQLYGAVPLVLETQTLDHSFKGYERTPKSEIVNQLLQDLDVAIAGLPNIAYTDGHAVRGSAILLKVRILMNNQRWAEAADAAWSLIGDPANPFKLHNNYSGIFFKEQKNNKEIMFSVQYQAPSDYHQLDQYVGSRMSFFPTKELRNAYETNPNTGLKDPRLKMTIFELGDPWVMHTSGTFSKAAGRLSEGSIPYTDLAFKKWIDPTIVAATSSTLSDQHIVKMRYAELLLSYAEAMFESGQGTDQRAIDALNAVRARPGVNMPPVTELTQNNIRNERRVELAFEGLRYNDIIRWGIAHEIIPTLTGSTASVKRKFNGYLWPIPQSQMDIMEGIWPQNFGY
jgi:starch-binding outer membrane protein, SusD/RagB family